MNEKLIFLDIDGTLTPPGGNVPPPGAAAAVRSAQARGHRLFLCTGRNLAMLSPLLAYGFEGAVSSAGGYVFIGDRVLYDCPMTDAQVQTAMSLFSENGVIRTIEARDGSWADEDLSAFLGHPGNGGSEIERIRRQFAEALNIRPMREYDGRPLYKILFMCREESQLDPARQALEKEFNFLIQERHPVRGVNGELVNRRFDKGRGVRAVADALGMDIADTIGFGDSMNDLEMIETVGVSVCMDNGSPKLKEISSLVCPAVEADGLAWAFDRLGLV